ncbi:peptidase domain-containing ABC transporter [Vibrio vulnificus]|nr:peptidase domain-containing ABC transporter [Vibrio vulnificus]HAS8118918.1 peptidase domain-containing ABC transporter [Vibrio vulnificus]
MKPVYQSEMAECGLACIAMVLGHYGHETSLLSLRKQFPQSLKGMNLLQINDIASQKGLTGNAVRYDIDELRSLQLPCLLHWDLNHFVVLTKVKRNTVEIVDPAKGRVQISFSEFSKHATGVALELSPSVDFKKQKERSELTLGQVVSSLQGSVPIFVQLIGLSIFLQVLALVSPLYMQIVIDDVITRHDEKLLLTLALAFALVLVVTIAVSCLRGLVVSHFGAELNKQLGSGLFYHLIRLPMTYFENRNIGDVTSRFNALRQIKQLLTGAMVESFIDGLMAITTLIMIFLYSPTLALVVIVSSALFVAMKLLMFRPLRALSEKSIVATASESSHFIETVKGMQSIKLSGLESHRMMSWKGMFNRSVNYTLRLDRLKIFFGTAGKLTMGIENLMVVFIGATLVLKQELTVGMLMAFMVYKTHFTTKLSSLIDKVIEFKMIGLHLERLSDIALSDREAHLEATENVDCTGRLELAGLSFKVEQSNRKKPLLDGLDLAIAPGECVAITGESGCGKTTLVKVILGLVKPDSGQVLVDGRDIYDIGLAEYRSHIGTVMQSDRLLSGSIADNIAGFDPLMDKERVVQSAKQACIHQTIATMPMGYNTMIGEVGSILSGGQIQRVLLARALYRQPKILIMDEATSHLDMESESSVNRSLYSLNITRLIVAHRPETIKMADRVLLMKDGSLIEQPYHTGKYIEQSA